MHFPTFSPGTKTHCARGAAQWRKDRGRIQTSRVPVKGPFTRYDRHTQLFVLEYVMLSQRHNSCFRFAYSSSNASGRLGRVNRIHQKEQSCQTIASRKRAQRQPRGLPDGNDLILEKLLSFLGKSLSSVVSLVYSLHFCFYFNG